MTPLINPDSENPVWAFQYFQKSNDCAKYFAEQLKFVKKDPSIPAEITKQSKTTA